MRATGGTAFWLGLAAVAPSTLVAQGYQLRVDTRVQSVEYRGVMLDSVAVSDSVTAAGYALNCSSNGYCTFFRPGPAIHTAPVSTTADVTAWGLGVSRLSVRAIGRAIGDLSSADNWPGTSSHIQLLEGYAEYAAGRWTAQVGRQTVASRFGFTGFDGGRLTLRDQRRGLELTAYGGWGLWRGAALPLTSPALNPLDEYRPAKRQLVAGASGGWTSRYGDVRVAYEREVDPTVDYFVSERLGADAVLRPLAGVSVTGGAEYDLAAGWWGSAAVTLAYAAPGGRINATAGVRRYRPHFDLWTIWGAFSPVPYTAVDGSVAVKPVAQLELRTRGEHYRYANTETATPLVSVESSGWRFSWGATYAITPTWVVDGGYRAEFGPGASSRGLEGGVTYSPWDELALTAHAATVYRPLEFRFDESSFDLVGLAADYRPVSRLRVQLDASRYAEQRKRPDPGAFSWDQVRVSARVILLFGGVALGKGLPPAVLGMPEKGSP